ncbi:MAG: hypothetical protein IJE97_05400 [Thermoguttaceae bacterium]|nr:hypothetical protein [Thermoguttaceae bacterium]
MKRRGKSAGFFFAFRFPASFGDAFRPQETQETQEMQNDARQSVVFLYRLTDRVGVSVSSRRFLLILPESTARREFNV